VRKIDEFKALEDACWLLNDRALLYSLLEPARLPELDAAVGRDLLYAAQRHLHDRQDELTANPIVRRAAALYCRRKAGML